jgi:hypothetical protein
MENFLKLKVFHDCGFLVHQFKDGKLKRSNFLIFKALWAWILIFSMVIRTVFNACTIFGDKHDIMRLYIGSEPYF